MSVDQLRENWVRQALQNEDLLPDYKITVAGTAEVGEGFVGGITFILVEGQRKDRKKVEFNLVIKDSIRGEKMKMTKVAFDREILMYDEVLPTLNKFGKGKLEFSAIAKCYTTISGRYQALIFENLKKIGYELHPIVPSMNQRHVKAIFKNYAKFHALSFAMRQEDPEHFQTYKKTVTEFFKHTFEQGEDFIIIFQRLFEKVGKLLKEHPDDQEILAKFNALGNICYKYFLETDFLADEPYTVVCHSDCWNNNYMFKYSDDLKAAPAEVAIIDWQISTISTPVRDLVQSYYCNTRTEDLSQVYEMLDFYYENLSANLELLGYDADKIFPKSVMMEHWKKYAKIGMIFAFCTYQMAFVDKSDIQELTTGGGDEDVGEKDSFVGNLNDVEGWYQKVLALVRHFVDFDLL